MTDYRDSALHRPDSAEGCGILRPDEVDAFLTGQLDPQRRAEFEAHARSGCGACSLLASDAALFATTVASGVVLTSEEAAGASRDREAIERWLARKAQHRRSLRRAVWAGSAVAASLLIVVGIRAFLPGPHAIQLPLQDGSSTPVMLLAFSAPGVQRGEEDLTSLWAAAGESYTSRRFALAAKSFENISRRAIDDVDAPLYQAVSLMALGRFDQALAALDRASERVKRGDIEGPALRWYRAVAFAGAERAAEAIPLLEELEREFRVTPASAGETDYGKLASELLARLHESEKPPTTSAE